MKEKIRKIHSDLNDGKITVSQATDEVLDLLAVSVNEVKLICEHQRGMESCGYKHKDVFTCKYLRNCEMCGN